MFEELSTSEMYELDGGFVLTGSMVVAGAGLVLVGCQVGWYVGKCIWGKR